MSMKSDISSPENFTAIIVAAGGGSRFGGDTPKQYLPIHGKPSLRHVLDCFLKCSSAQHILVVIQDGHQLHYEKAIKGISSKLLPPVIGGKTRQESVRNAVLALDLADEDLVLIHDAARPCVTQAEIMDVVSALSTHQAATLTTPVFDTLRKTENGVLKDTVDRTSLSAVQTPQGFHFGILKMAHQTITHQEFTDDTGLVSNMGIAVVPVTGTRKNIKLTTPDDLEMIQKILTPTLLPHIGMGFDVHAFGESSDKICLGGIEIPHTHKLSGHSDADVVLHAITDALYGTLSDGDIGSHFPPSNVKYKGMDSAVFLKSAAAAVQECGGKIQHIDVTIICEAPKIGPYRDSIRARIAEILDLPIKKISIKATTTEQLGFTGRREGIAAQAVATVLLPSGDSHEI